MKTLPSSLLRWGRRWRGSGRIAAAVFFVAAGLNHFRDPAFYLAMMPPQLPAHDALNVVSGLAEIAGGGGLLVPKLRRWAGWGLVALLIAVFPANVFAAWRGSIPGTSMTPLQLWLRLPFQAVFLAWAWWHTR